MNKKIITIGIIGMFLLTTIPTLSALGIKTETNKATNPINPLLTANTIYVDDDASPGGDGSFEKPYQTINEGINAAINDDTVFVFKGNYPENVLIDKSITLTGEDKETTFIKEHTVVITADNAKVSGFTISHISGGDVSGIKISDSDHCTISDNIVTYISGGGEYINGINLEDSYSCNISDNTVLYVTGGERVTGIRLCDSQYCTIYNNDISYIEVDGVDSFYSIGIAIRGSSSYCNIYGNTLSNLSHYYTGSASVTAIQLDTDDSNISDNIISEIINYGEGDAKGIYISSCCDNNIITRNVIKNINCQDYSFGMRISGWGTTITDNIVKQIYSEDRSWGILLDEEHCNINENTIENIRGRRTYGLYVYWGAYGTIKNNVVLNVEGSVCACGLELFLMEGTNYEVEGNFIENIWCTYGPISFGGRGINIYCGYNINLTNNIVNKNSGGIRLFGSETGNIIGNTISNTKAGVLPGEGYGISLEESTYFNINNNKFKDNHKDATFYFEHILDEGEPYKPGDIPRSYDEIRNEKDRSNTWNGNYWDTHKNPKPKKIIGTLVVFESGDPVARRYLVNLENFDYEPKAKSRIQNRLPINSMLLQILEKLISHFPLLERLLQNL